MNPWQAFSVYRYGKGDRSAAYLTVLDILLATGRAVNQDDDLLPAIRTFDFH